MLSVALVQNWILLRLYFYGNMFDKTIAYSEAFSFSMDMDCRDCNDQNVQYDFRIYLQKEIGGCTYYFK